MRVLVSGSSGLIGTALVQRLRTSGHTVVRLVRSAPQANEVSWDPATGSIDDGALEGFDAVIHLGGVSIGEKRWTEAEKERIWNSRVVSTELLAKRLLETVAQPQSFIVSSAIGYYGSQGDQIITEESVKGEGFLAELCDQWEDAARPAAAAGIRIANLRTGVVLSDKGGALAKQIPLFRLCLGGRIGTGQQYLSWISLHDQVSAIVHVLEHPELSGPVNCTAPNPVTNETFTAELGSALHRPTAIPAWPWLLKAGFGAQLTEEVLMASQRVRPAKLLNSDFRFRDDTLVKAFGRIFGRPAVSTEPTPAKERVVDLVDDEDDGPTNR